MKINIKILVCFLTLVMILAGCGGNSVTPTPTNPGNNSATNSPGPIEEVKSKYFFNYKDISIYMNAEAKPILEALGEPMHYFESPSCAFQGMDRVYTYDGFEVYTYTEADNTEEYVFTIVFMNDGVETVEGITLGNKLEDVIAKYGEDYTKDGDKYSYTDQNTYLSFVIKDGEVADLSYNLVLN